MAGHDGATIRATDPTLPVAIEQALSGAIVDPGGAGTSPFLVGFDAEAPDLPRLVEAAFHRLSALLMDHEASAIACIVNGLHVTDEGQRVWGTLECRAGRQDRESTRVDGVRVEQLENGHWDVTFRLHKGLDDDLLGQRRPD